MFPCKVLLLSILCCLVVSCGPSGTEEERIDARRAPGDAADASVSDLPDAMNDGADAQANVCGPANSECGVGSYLDSCTGGQCFGEGCCCPDEQRCRAGSFPVCCAAGAICIDTATGECG